MRVRSILTPLLTLALGACATLPRPPILSEVETLAESERTRQSREWAPQAHAHARRLLQRAASAYADDEDLPAASALGEHASAAFQRAIVLGRLAQAERRAANARAALTRTLGRVAELDAELVTLTAAADARELQVKVARDAVPLVPNEPADAKRDAARRAAARHLLEQARLLCLGAGLLGEREDSTQYLLELDALDAKTASTSTPAPIDDAVRLRSSCLQTLTKQRRSDAAAGAAPDRLLAELSESGAEPRRDDRGVVLVARDLFRGDALSATGREAAQRWARVAKAHSEFPLLVLVHSARERDRDRDQRRARELTAALETAGASRVAARAVGTTLPLAPIGVRDAAHQNERVEIVFVSPAR